MALQTIIGLEVIKNRGLGAGRESRLERVCVCLPHRLPYLPLFYFKTTTTTTAAADFHPTCHIIMHACMYVCTCNNRGCYIQYIYIYSFIIHDCMLYTVSPHLPYVLSSYIHDNSKSNKNRCILQPRERHQQVRLAVVCLIHSHRNASFLVTAKNASDHSCWMFDSVAGFLLASIHQSRNLCPELPLGCTSTYQSHRPPPAAEAAPPAA